MKSICSATTFVSAMLTIVVQAQAGNKLYVGNLPFAQGFTFSDISTQPPNDLVDTVLDLSDAHEGSIGSPGTSLPSSFQLGVIDPDPNGFADTGFFEVYYDGAPGTYPTSSVFGLFFDVFFAGTSQKGFKKLDTDGLVGPKTNSALLDMESATGELLHAHWKSEIKANQPGLSFVNLDISQSNSSDPLSSFDILFQLHHDGSGAIDPSQPLFQVTLTPVPEPNAVILGAIASLGLLYIRARTLE